MSGKSEAFQSGPSPSTASNSAIKHSELRPYALGLVLLGGLLRLTPHPWNFTPVGGMSLFAGARMRGWTAYLLPLLVMVVTDPLVGGYSVGTPIIYACFLINVWIGRKIQNTEKPALIAGCAFLCSLQFFLITNFAFWIIGDPRLYPLTFAGLLQSYAMGLPFFGRMLLGDLFYSGVFFGLHAWLTRTVAQGERVPQCALSA